MSSGGFPPVTAPEKAGQLFLLLVRSAFAHSAVSFTPRASSSAPGSGSHEVIRSRFPIRDPHTRDIRRVIRKSPRDGSKHPAALFRTRYLYRGRPSKNRRPSTPLPRTHALRASWRRAAPFVPGSVVTSEEPRYAPFSSREIGRSGAGAVTFPFRPACWRLRSKGAERAGSVHRLCALSGKILSEELM